MLHIDEGTMSRKALSLKTAAVLAATTLMLAACSSSNSASLRDASVQDMHSSRQQYVAEECGAWIERSVASCQFTNELEHHQRDGSGVSPCPALDRGQLGEDEDAYVVTFTADFIAP